MDATQVIVRKTALAEGTAHTVFSELQQPDSWPETIRWRNTSDLEVDRLMEVLLGLLEREEKQRISIPCLQQYVADVSVAKLCSMLDDLAIHVRDNNGRHQISCPTLRFVPSTFMYWGEIKQLNDHIKQVSSQQGWPTLNMARSFMMRQGARWVVASKLYCEFNAEEGFGTTFTPLAFERYQARLLRFHETGFDTVVPFYSPVSDPEPMPLFRTNTYIRCDYTRELLVSLGYKIVLPVQAKAVKKKGKKVKVAHKKEDEKAEAMEVDGVERGAKRMCPDPVMAEVRDQERRPDWTEKMYETMPVLKGTMADMLYNLSYLKEKVKGLERERDQEMRKRHAKDAECYNYSRQMRAVHIRYNEYDRKVANMAEEAYQENREWQELRREWRREKEELLDELYQERRLVNVMEGKLEVYEGGVSRKKNKGAKKERD